MRAWHGFARHRGIDSAASLAYFGSLALFPGMLAVVSAFGVLDNRKGAQEDILAILASVVESDTVDAVRAPLAQLLSLPNPGIGLAVGLVLTLWTLSGYVTAFGRAVNNAYEVQEGRRIWKFRGLMIAVAAVLMVGFALMVTILVITPGVADALATTYGVAPAIVVVWNFGKWPVLAALALGVVAILYYYSPNVRHPRLRWVSWGALFAITAWALATLGFIVYVASAAHFNEVYGWLGGAVIVLIWLYLTNFVLVLGAEVDVEIARARQLVAGIPAEETIQLPVRDTTRNLVLARRRAEDHRRGRELRENADRERET